MKLSQISESGEMESQSLVDDHCDNCGGKSSVDSGTQDTVSNSPVESDDETDEEEIHIYEEEEYGFDATEGGRIRKEFQIASVSGVPEIKVTKKKKCKKVWGRKICWWVPNTCTRKSSYKAYARITVARIDNRDVENALRDCVRSAAIKAGVAGALAAMATGGSGLSAVVPTFKRELARCLRSRALQTVADSVSVKLFTKKKTGSWKC